MYYFFIWRIDEIWKKNENSIHRVRHNEGLLEYINWLSIFIIIIIFFFCSVPHYFEQINVCMKMVQNVGNITFMYCNTRVIQLFNLSWSGISDKHHLNTDILANLITRSWCWYFWVLKMCASWSADVRTMFQPCFRLADWWPDRVLYFHPGL